MGPAVCLEVKPKWGLHPSEVPRGPEEEGGGGGAEGGGAEGAGEQEPLRRRYPRFMLHMRHKHIKVRTACLHYSLGRLGRM